MKRVLVASFHHESNTFNPIIAGEKDFFAFEKEELYNQFKDNDSLTGICTTLINEGYEIVPTVFMRGVPNGIIDKEFYLSMKHRLLEIALEEHKKQKIDAFCLALHGSMRIVEIGEAEGDLLLMLREYFPTMPIFASLDMHTTMTQAMFDCCDGYVGYKCAPHTDCSETGIHAAKLVVEYFNSKTIPNVAWVKVPFLVAGEKSSTNTQPMIDLIQELRNIEKIEGVQAASYLMGFPWADNEDSAVGVYVVANTKQLAKDNALHLAHTLWNRLYDFSFHTETYDEYEAIDVAIKALENKEYPVYLSDSGDNPTAGSSGDCVELLEKLLLDERINDEDNPILFSGVYDPSATLSCKDYEQQEITLTFGACFDCVSSHAITRKGIVKKYISNLKVGSVISDVALFYCNGVNIIIASKHIGYMTPQLYIDLGLNPKEIPLICVKLGYLTQHHEVISKRSIMALSKGSTNEDLTTLPYHKIQRPMYPLDTNFEYDALLHYQIK